MAGPWTHNRRFSRRGAAQAVLWAACCLAGCRAVDHAQVDVMERELRQQEDYIFELEDVVMTYSEKLRECRACQMAMTAPTSSETKGQTRGGEPTLADDRRRSSAPPRRAGSRSVRPIPPVDEPPAEVPAVEEPEAPPTEPNGAPEAEPIDPDTFEPGELDIGPTSDLDWQDAAPIATTPGSAVGEEAPPYIPDPANYQIDAEPIAPITAEPFVPDASQLLADDDATSEVPAPTLPELSLSAPEGMEPGSAPPLPPPADPSRLTADRLQIRCLYAEPANGDTGKAPSLLAVVEALNATDEPVDADGEVSLMVMAGESQESLQRVDRWDFSSEETQAAWQSSPLGDGLHLELPLNISELPPGPLELYVRLVKSDGTKLLARVPFQSGELMSLDEALANPAPAESLTPAAETGEQLVDAAVATPAAAIEPTPAPPTDWRTSSEPLAAGRVEGYASAKYNKSGWTRQAPGRAPAPTPRVASAPGKEPRWQQGSAKPADSEAWTPFR